MSMGFLSPGGARIFRVTHIDNLPWILRNGLHCPTSETRDPNFRAIGNPELIGLRMTVPVPCPPGGVLGDYVPFYFTPRSIMLFNIVTGWRAPRVPMVPRENLVIVESSIGSLAVQGIGCVLTDRHAKLRTTNFTADLTAGLERIDWSILRTSDFRNTDDDRTKQERYQAEALVHSHLPVTAIDRIVCYRAEEQAKINAVISASGLTTAVEIQPYWFFE